MNTQPDKELLPCPFCGGKAEIKQNARNGYKLKCTSCVVGITQKTLRNSMEWLEEVMIRDWNKRTTPPTAKEGVSAEDNPHFIHNLFMEHSLVWYNDEWLMRYDQFKQIFEEYASLSTTTGAATINYGALVEDKMYPVLYTVLQSGEKVFDPKWIDGKDLTEPQIKYLYDLGYFKRPTPTGEGKDGYTELNLNDYILVQITEYGWNELIEKFGAEYTLHCIKSRIEIVNGEEYYKLQHHVVISTFGKMAFASYPAPISCKILIPSPPKN